MNTQAQLLLREPRKPRDVMADALVWIDANRTAWSLVVREARRDAAHFGRVRVKRTIEDLRDNPIVERTVGRAFKMPNAYSAAFGRILASWYPNLEPFIPLHASKTDGCVIPPVPDWARSL